jgi:predicted RNase H-like HicB family nuclease
MEETTKSKKQPCVAMHGQSPDGTQHIVGFGNLKVVLLEDEGQWFAQALEIDYLAQGKNLEEAKKNFESGLRATININLQNFGNIEKMLKSAPPEVWKEAAYVPGATFKRYSQVSIHEVLNSVADENVFPFDAIEYFAKQSTVASLPQLAMA